MTDPIGTALHERTDMLTRSAVRPPATGVLREARRRRMRRQAAGPAVVTALAAVGLAVAIPQLSSPDSVRLVPGAPAPEDAEARMFGAGLVRGDNLARDHRTGPIAYPDYPSRPPLGGDHSPTPQQCAVYPDPIPAEHAVHSLEHGATWITYNASASPSDVAQLVALVDEDPAYRIISPLPGQQDAIVLTAWSRQLSVDTADDPRIRRFLDYYTNGPQTPERGAGCLGTSVTGTTPLDP